MNGLASALWAELLKTRRSRVPWLTALGFSLAPLAGGLFMVILRDPEWARRSGLISAKAQITVGTADWPAYVAVMGQATAIGGFLLFGLVAIWVFGREYADRTAKDLLALPVSREAIVVAKFITVACWSGVLVAIACGLALTIGQTLALPGGSAELVREAAATLVTVAALSALLVTPLAWAATAGRGYLPAIGLMFLAVFLGQVLAALGWGEYFPWAVPALASGAAGPDAQQLGAVSYLLVALTGLIGMTLTLAWWRWADQTV